MSIAKDPLAQRLTLSLCLTVLVVSCVGVAIADEVETINAERPGFSSSPIALAPSLFQIEGGYQYTRESSSPDIDDHTLPFAMFRFGLAERLELQLSWSGYSWTDVGGLDNDGVNDADVGVKWQLTDENSKIPVAVFVGTSLPVGDDEYTSDEFDPTFGVFWSFDASLSWFGTVLVSESDDDWSLSNAVGINLPINADTGSYLEYYSTFTDGSGPEHYLNGGFTYLPRHDMQLDVYAGAGLNSRATDLYVGMGIAYQF